MGHFFEQGFSVREPMWHGLGTILGDYPGRADAMEAAGHDFTIYETPVSPQPITLPTGIMVAPYDAENWKALRAVGEHANKRLCDAQAPDARPAPDVVTLGQVTRPSTTDAVEHAPAAVPGPPGDGAHTRHRGVLPPAHGCDNRTLTELMGINGRRPLHPQTRHLRLKAYAPQGADPMASAYALLPAHPTRRARRGPVHQDQRPRTCGRSRRTRPSPTRRAGQTRALELPKIH